MTNIHELRIKLKKLNKKHKLSDILHELSLLNIPEDVALQIYDLSIKLFNLNY